MENEQNIYEKFREMFPETRRSCAWLWIEFAQDIARRYGMSSDEYTNKLIDQFTALKEQYGDTIAEEIYCAIQCGSFLPHEMILAAEYLKGGGRGSKIAEMARNGAFENGIDYDWLEPSDAVLKEDMEQLPDIKLK